jgi:hypothetical protein
MQPAKIPERALDPSIGSAEHAYLRHFRSSTFEGVQLGQVAIYCRVSTDDQSCERQERDLRAFARRAGHHIVGVYKETASGARNDRVERRKVMALAQARQIDAILVTELSRWGRSTQDLVHTLDDLHSWKVSVLAQTGLSFDLGTANHMRAPLGRHHPDHNKYAVVLGAIKAKPVGGRPMDGQP